MNRFLSTKQTGVSATKKNDIIENLMEAILSGILPRNERIPSRKELARHFAVNPKTIDRAVLELTDRSVLVTKQRQGTYVTPRALLDSTDIYGKHFGPYVRPAHNLADLTPYVILGSTELNPYFFLQPCMKKISQVTLGLIQQPLDSWLGLSANPHHLRDVLLTNVSMREGKYYASENFLLLSGRLHTLRMITRLLVQPGDIVIMTNPCLLNQRVFTELGAEVWTVPQTNCGVRAAEVRKLNELARQQKRNIALLYTNLQTDYGTCKEEDKRRAMHELLLETAKLDIVLLEEFEDHELMYEHVLTFSDVAQAPMSHVVSIRSYSKLLAMYNELRIVLAAASFISLLKEWDDHDVNYGFLYEVLASRLLEANIFAVVMEPVANLLSVQMRLLVKKCTKVLGKWARIMTPLCGTSFWITALGEHEIIVPVNTMRKLNVHIRGVYQEASIVKTRSLLLGFGDGATQELRQAIKIIGGEMNRHYPA